MAIFPHKSFTGNHRSVAVECCYQNTGIATSVAVAMFQGDELAVAVGVPLFYGICEAVFLAIYCITCWKIGWTKAPRDENICRVIFTSYEVKELMESEPESIEVVLGGVENGPTDLIFARTKEGYQIDEVSLESLTNPEDGEFTIDDLDEGDEDTKVELEIPKESENPTAMHGQRSRRAYDSVDVSSPSQPRNLIESVPPSGELPLSRNQTTHNPVKNALSSLSSRVRGTKYAKASVTTNGDVDDVPAAGKHID